MAPSIVTGDIVAFSGWDYAVFVLLLVAFAGVGMYHAVMDRRRRKDNCSTEFMLGGRSMPIFPVAMSLTVTFMSALTILGNPREMYSYNTMFVYLIVALMFAMAGAGLVFIPFFYRLGVTSTFEYLEWRFHWSVRCLGSALSVFQALVYMSFVLYAPCLALSAVTGLNLWGCVVGVCFVVTFYTTLGGMKAVVWTDTLQFIIMIGGLLAVLIQGSIEVGGFSHAWSVAEDEGRIVFDDFSFDPSTRHSFWSIVVGGGFLWMSLFGINQAQVQRCLSTASVKKAQLAILLNIPGLLLINTLTFLIGIVMFTYYVDCDPVLAGIIKKDDQLLPLFVTDILSHAKGMPGVFVACILSGSLSSLSSAMNAISTIVYRDFIQRFCCVNLSDTKATIINKLLVIASGILAIGTAYLASQAGPILQASYTIYGILGGPLFGLFALGMFFPWSNSMGAIVGTLGSLLFMSWIGIGGVWHKVSTAVKSPLKGCTSPFINVTAPAIGLAKSYDGVFQLYTLSYLYYTLVGSLVCVMIGLIVSFITGHTKTHTLDPGLICLPGYGRGHISSIKNTTYANNSLHTNPSEENGKQGLSNPGFIKENKENNTYL